MGYCLLLQPAELQAAAGHRPMAAPHANMDTRPKQGLVGLAALVQLKREHCPGRLCGSRHLLPSTMLHTLPQRWGVYMYCFVPYLDLNLCCKHRWGGGPGPRQAAARLLREKPSRPAFLPSSGVRWRPSRSRAAWWVSRRVFRPYVAARSGGELPSGGEGLPWQRSLFSPFSGVIGGTSGATLGFSLGHCYFAKVFQLSMLLCWHKTLILGYFRMVFNIEVRAVSSQMDFFFFNFILGFPLIRWLPSFQK